MGGHRVVSTGVILAGAGLAVSPLLPWAGVRAEVPVLGRGLGTSVLGFDDAAGWFVCVAGVVAAVLGVAGLTHGRAFTGFAIVPGAAGALALAVFINRPERLLDLSVTIAGLVRVGPRIEYGWFVGLGASILINVLAAIALFRRQRS
ncbi:hypothetical protein AB0K60_11565 [Thermopolyspora sp. NPDC052614]|uniref:hypothetical protein n=1 Tax=Thermopolyspora sp. NPDC052614 TaxID=3155682 RepID=UPI00342A6B5E